MSNDIFFGAVIFQDAAPFLPLEFHSPSNTSPNLRNIARVQAHESSRWPFLYPRATSSSVNGWSS